MCTGLDHVHTHTVADDRTGSCTDNMAVDRIFLLVSWCFEPSQPQRITSGLRVDTGLDHIQTIQLWMGLDYIETI